MAQPLAEHAYQALKADILSCVLQPGALITEADLAKRYGMSKTPVREALSLLAHEHFVDTLPRRGTIIAPVSIRDVQHTFFLRMLLEPEAAALAAQRATGPQLQVLASYTVPPVSTPETHGIGPGHLSTTNRLFHVAVGQASGVPRLADTISGLLEHVERFYNSHQHRTTEAAPQNRHQELLDAIVGGHVEASRELMGASIRESRQHLITTLLDEPQSATHLHAIE